MLGEARDILGNMFLEDRLSVLREAYLDLVMQGNAPDPASYWPEGEKRIFDELKARYYSGTARALVKSPDAGDIGDAKDFDGRTQKLGEQAALLSHRRLVELPCHGHVDFEEE